jgi:hypothetical protein
VEIYETDDKVSLLKAAIGAEICTNDKLVASNFLCLRADFRAGACVSLS